MKIILLVSRRWFEKKYQSYLFDFSFHYNTGISPFALRDTDSKSAILRAKHGSEIRQRSQNHAYRNLRRNARK